MKYLLQLKEVKGYLGDVTMDTVVHGDDDEDEDGSELLSIEGEVHHFKILLVTHRNQPPSPSHFIP